MKLIPVCTGVAAVITAAGMINAMYQNMPVPDSVKEFHEEEQALVQEQMDDTQGMVTAMTIPPIRNNNCRNPSNNEMRELLAERVQQYEKLMKRKYSMPPCPQVESGN